MKKFLLFPFILTCFAAHASHIVGGELYYDCVGTNQYRITLKLYRDCYCINCAPFGDPEYLAIFTSNGGLHSQPAMPFTGSLQLGSTFSNPCLVEPDICVERAIYTALVTLPATAGGYNIVYNRCCRSTGVVNIQLDQGASYQVHIPGSSLATCNSSARFNTFPPLFICDNAPLVLDHSASDPDGDQLVYSLCDPLVGADADCPSLIPTNSANGVVGTISGQPCPDAPDPPPYAGVNYTAPYNSSNFLNNPGNANNLRIDPQTGVITGTPNAQGMFVVAVCVSEYRGGVLLGEMRRDFQFNVALCNIPVANVPSTNIDPQTGVGTYILTCKAFTVNFINTSYNPPPLSNPIYYHWDFGVNTSTTDTSNLFAPTFTYPDTGAYLVTLIAIKDAGGGLVCTDTTYAYVFVYPTFSTDFTRANICQDSAATFTSQIISTNGNIDLWNWNFGDGGTSAQDNPSHLYTTPGNYTVTLIGGNDLGCRDTTQKNIVIYETPIAAFTFNNPCVSQPLNFTNTSTGTIGSQTWTFGNGASDTQPNPSTTYTSTGSYDVTLFLTTANGCKDTAVQTLTVNPVPDVRNDDTTICLGESVQLRANGGTVYTWSPSSGLSDSTIANPMATPTPPAAVTYNITAVNQFQCSASDAITISFFPPPSVAASIDTSVCLSGANFRDSVEISASGALTYLWTPANSLSNALIANPVARPTFNSTYYVIGTDANGCRALDSVIVYVLDPSLNVVVEDFKNVCLNDTVYIEVISQGSSNYVWTPNQFIVDETTLRPGFYPTVSSTYTLSISNYCYSKGDSVRIVVLPLPTLTFNHIDSICLGDSVVLSVSGAQTYQWDFDATLSEFDISNPMASPIVYTVYYVNAVDANGCETRDSTSVNLLPLPMVNAGNDTLIYRDTPAFLNGATDGVIYFWSPTTYLDDYHALYTKAEVPKTQEYVLYAENNFGCSWQDTVLIIVEARTFLMLPTGFSPNDDGVNDLFRIVRHLNIDKLKDFSVFNRWGERVFVTTDINDGWNGTYKNREQELGVYVWQVVALTKDAEEIVRKGNVTLVR